MISLRLPMVLITGLAFGGSMLWKERKRRRWLMARMGAREPMSPRAFLAATTMDLPLETVESFLQLLGKELRLDASKLLPSDHLTADLGGCELPSSSRLFFITRLERAFECSLPTADVCFGMTVGELLRTITASQESSLPS